ncbi:MAG TPA: adenylate/guanylate cyclase domain-containing protein [Gemmatimonadales bacterium]|nr:adenylate/guanylate cyclase domain-containing protein [Gemmatimonadales bacterium]
MPARPPYRLVSVAGDQRFDLPADRSVVVGRGVTSDLAVYDPTISRVHAELTVEPDGVRVRDLGSSNGTCINGERVAIGRLTAGDSISFGKVLFQLEAAGAADPTQPAPRHQPFVPAVQPPGGTIVREVVVQGGVAGITSGEGPDDEAGAPGETGRLRVGGRTQEERVMRKLSLLLDVSQKLSGEFDLDRLLRTVVDITFEVMHVDRVAILLRHETTGELVPRISRSRLGDSHVLPVPRSIARKVVEERVAVVSQNAAADARFKGRSILMQSVRSAMCSPLMASAEEVLGILYVDNLTSTDSFSDEDLQFIVAFSGIAAVGIKNSRYAEQIRREALVRSNFERYFAPNVASEIAQQPGAVKLGGDKRPTTILFADIRGFTPMAEAMAPEAIAQLLTDCFTEMVDVVFEYGGTLDKFIGDSVMALWGAPIAHADDPDRALQAAIAMQRAVEALNHKWAATGRPPVRIGIGLNYGEVFAGNIGSHRRLEYTVIGDPVNVAARLCTNAGGGEILVTDALLAALKTPVEAQPLAEITLKGKAQAVAVYRVKY